MAKENNVKPQEAAPKAKGFDVEEDLKTAGLFNGDIAKKAMEDLATQTTNERVTECKEIVKETMFMTKSQLLKVRKNSKLEEAEKDMMKGLCVLNDKGEVVGGLLREVLDGKISGTEFAKRKKAFKDDYKKKVDTINNNFDEKHRELVKVTPGYVWGYDWF